MTKQQKKDEVHVGFLFASPICIKDNNVQGVRYTKRTPIDQLKVALLNHYKKEGFSAEEANQAMENQIRIPNSESTDPDLSDITKIRNIPWSKLKTIAVQENFEQHKFFVGYNKEEQAKVRKLIETQKEQDDMLPIRSQDYKLLEEKRKEKIIQFLNEKEEEKNKQKGDWCTDFLPQLNFLNEMKAIKRIMKKSRTELVFKGSVATDQNFIDMLNCEPRLLHISCHGLRVNLKQGAYVDTEKKEKENCLLFETSTGEGHLISSKMLNKHIK